MGKLISGSEYGMLTSEQYDLVINYRTIFLVIFVQWILTMSRLLNKLEFIIIWCNTNKVIAVEVEGWHEK